MRLLTIIATIIVAVGGALAQHGQVATYLDVVRCLGKLDVGCVLDHTEDILVDSTRQLLVEADASAAISGRKTPADENPSSLVDSISSLFGEITDLLFRHSYGKEETANVDADDGKAEANDKPTAVPATTLIDTKQRSMRSSASEARGKKKKEKKRKVKAIIKLLILAAIFYGKVALFLKLLAAHLQLKFLAIAAGSFLINAARFYWDLKKGHHPQKVIYYEHAQHQHHYDTEDDSWGGGGGGSHHGGYWGRAYESDEKNGQDLAYRKQKPSDSWL